LPATKAGKRPEADKEPKANLSEVTSLSRLACTVLVALLAVCIASTSAYSDSARSPSPIKAVQVDTIRLLGANVAERPIRIDNAFVFGDEALVLWGTANARGLVVLHLKDGRWWWRAGASTANRHSGYWSKVTSPGETVTDCDAGQLSSPSAAELFSLGFISKKFNQVLRNRLLLIRPRYKPSRAVTSCDFPYSLRDDATGYDVKVTGAGVSPAVEIHGDANQTAEGAPSIYGFSLTTHASDPQVLEAGTRLVIWLPFAADPAKTYRLTLLTKESASIVVDGDLWNNVATFTLPRVTVDSHNRVRGEIDEITKPGSLH
jgi:hypothetical protein